MLVEDGRFMAAAPHAEIHNVASLTLVLVWCGRVLCCALLALFMRALLYPFPSWRHKSLNQRMDRATDNLWVGTQAVFQQESRTSPKVCGKRMQWLQLPRSK